MFCTCSRILSSTLSASRLLRDDLQSRVFSDTLHAKKKTWSLVNPGIIQEWEFNLSTERIRIQASQCWCFGFGCSAHWHVGKGVTRAVITNQVIAVCFFLKTIIKRVRLPCDPTTRTLCARNGTHQPKKNLRSGLCSGGNCKSSGNFSVEFVLAILGFGLGDAAIPFPAHAHAHIPIILLFLDLGEIIKRPTCLCRLFGKTSWQPSWEVGNFFRWGVRRLRL